MGRVLNSIYQMSSLSQLRASVFHDLAQEIISSISENRDAYQERLDYPKIQHLKALIEKEIDPDENSLQQRILRLYSVLFQESPLIEPQDIQAYVDLLLPDPILELKNLKYLLIHGDVREPFFTEILKKYIPQLIKTNPLPLVIQELVEVLTASQIPFIGKNDVKIFVDSLIKSSSVNTTQLDISQAILDYALTQGNGVVIQYMKDNYPQFLENYMEKANENNKSILKKYLDYVNRGDPTNSASVLFQFSNGLGKIEYDGGLLTFAQIHERKIKDQYDFNPTLLKEDEYNQYFKAIQDCDGPLTEYFAVTGLHWISGVIHKDSKGTVSLLIVDPLGFDKDGDIFTETEDIIKDAKTIFSQNKLKIYFDGTRRQNDKVACSVIAIDDLQHLYTTEKNWQKQHFNENLFSFLRNNKIHKRKFTDSDNDHFTLNLTTLPLTLMRTMQSRRLEEVIIPSRKGKEPEIINKRGETAAQSSSRSFIFNLKANKKQNMRLVEKFQKMRQYNQQYLLTTDSKKIHETIKLFTLEHFIQRIQLKPTMISDIQP